MTPLIETLLAEAYDKDVETIDVVQVPNSASQLVFVVGPRAVTDKNALKDVKRALIQRRGA